MRKRFYSFPAASLWPTREDKFDDWLWSLIEGILKDLEATITRIKSTNSARYHSVVPSELDFGRRKLAHTVDQLLTNIDKTLFRDFCKQFDFGVKASNRWNVATKRYAGI